jgi:hypothetical protein
VLPLNAFELFIYGATYGYLDVYQKAAPIVVLQKHLNDVLPRLPANLLMPWVILDLSFVMNFDLTRSRCYITSIGVTLQRNLSFFTIRSGSHIRVASLLLLVKKISIPSGVLIAHAWIILSGTALAAFCDLVQRCNLLQI